MCARKHLPLGNITTLFTPTKTYTKNLHTEITNITNRLGKIYIENASNHAITINGGALLGQITEMREAYVCTLAQFLDTRENTQMKVSEILNLNANTKIPDHLLRQMPPGFTIETHLSKQQQEDVAKLVTKHRTAFIINDLDYGLTNLTEHKIELTDTTPIHVRQFRLDRHRAQALDEIVDKLNAKDKMEQSLSPWNMPIFVIKKPTGTWRLVSDFRLQMRGQNAWNGLYQIYKKPLIA